MSNKQSSVEWLLNQITYDNGYGQRRASFIDTEDLTSYFEQAKAMHKDEHSNTWDDSVDNYKKRGENDMRHWVDFDEYYKDKFK